MSMRRQELSLYAIVFLILLSNVSCNSDRGFFEKVYDFLADVSCNFKYECCRTPFVRSSTVASHGLRIALKNDFFGQHIAVKTVLNAIDAHLRDKNPKKPLVLSFHGWAGSGKTFLSHLIAKSLYEKGLKSNYVRLYSASYHFPDEKKVAEYKIKLQKEITETLEKCERALIIFDEVDVTPPSLFDSLVAFLDYSSIVAANSKKAIYIFLSNIGSNEISQKAYQAWKDGLRREELTFTDFHLVVSKASFNAANTGLGKTRIIERSLVDFFVPFLPMERKHIIECAKVEIRRQQADLFVDPNSIADQMLYWPDDMQLFSSTGCKRVEQLVKYAVSDKKFETIQHDEI